MFCRRQLGKLREVEDEIRELGAELWVVSPDDAESLDEFIVHTEYYVQSLKKYRVHLADEMDHVDEFAQYADYLLQSARKNLEHLLDEAKELDQFLSYGDLLLRSVEDEGLGAANAGRPPTEPRTEDPELSDAARAWRADLARLMQGPGPQS